MRRSEVFDVKEIQSLSEDLRFVILLDAEPLTRVETPNTHLQTSKSFRLVHDRHRLPQGWRFRYRADRRQPVCVSLEIVRVMPGDKAEAPSHITVRWTFTASPAIAGQSAPPRTGTPSRQQR
jgi:hypothetical protein